jgi:anti-anti-sigma factor
MCGRLDSGTAKSFEEDALLCIESGAHEMVFDGTQLSYISGAGLRAVLSLARAMQETQGRLAACNLQPQVEEMFDVSGIDVLVPVYQTRDEAFAALAA